MSTLHQNIYEYLTEKIESGEFPQGSMLPSDSELAIQFSTSRQTILRAMERLSLEGHIKRLQGKGSIVQRQQVRAPGGNKLISFICGDIANSFGQRVASGIERKLRELDYELILCQHGHEDEKEAAQIRKSISRGVDGIILIPANPLNSAKIISEELLPASIPFLCVDNPLEGIESPLIETDNYHGAYEAVSHLCKNGHKRIAFIVTMKEKIESLRTVSQRFAGYKQALEDHGISFDPELIAELGPELSGKRPHDAGYKIFGYQPMNKLLRLPTPPTAVFLLWDELAFGVMSAIEDAGLKIPGDIALVGFNDDPIASITPVPLSSVRQPAEELGTSAAEMIVNLINGKPCRKQICLKNTLIPRESSNILK